MKFYNRSDFNIYYLMLSGKSYKERTVHAIQQLNSLYPQNLTADRILIQRNGHGKDWIVAVNNSCSNDANKELSTLFLVKKLQHFTGKASFVSKTFTEICTFSKGKILSSECFKDLPNSLYSSVDIIYSTYSNLEDKRFVNKNTTIIHLSKQYNPARTRKIIAFILLILLILTLSILFRVFYLSFKTNQNKRLNDLREKEFIQQQNIKKQSQMDYCASLKQKYKDLTLSVPVPAYFVCSLLYDCMDTTCLINSLSISGNTFTIELRCKDTLKILKNFEMQSGLCNCSIERSIIEKGTNIQTCTLTGEVLQNINLPETTKIEEQISYYTTEISKLEQKRTKQSSLSLAEAAMNIRSLLKNNFCSEEYFQRISDGTYTEFEVGIRGTSKNILSFIQSCSGIWDFRSIRIKNYTDQNSISSVFRVITWIPINQSSFSPDSIIPKLSSPQIMSHAFTKGSIAASQKASIPNKIPKQENQSVQKASWLIYIGTGKFNTNNEVIFIKNSKTGEILHLQNYSITEDGSYIVTLGDKQYEVVK